MLNLKLCFKLFNIISGTCNLIQRNAKQDSRITTSDSDLESANISPFEDISVFQHMHGVNKNSFQYSQWV